MNEQTRRPLANAIVMITDAAHQRMEIKRVWVAVDPLDPFAKYLSMSTGFRLEGQVQRPDGHVMDQYSSIA